MEPTVRNGRGQFVKGARPHPATEFQPGQHWRDRKPFWDKEWLEIEYTVKGRSCGDIAADFGLTEASILFWLRKHEIPRRTVSQAREQKHWGQSGESNGMFGRRGPKSPAWKGGGTPDRQAFYNSIEWKDVSRLVWARDERTCQRCRRDGPRIHIHHIVSFSVVELRAEISNLVLLCETCHRWVHSNKNVNRTFIRDVS